MRKIQELLLGYLENDDSADQYFQNANIINDLEIIQNKYELKLFLHLISQISANHHRGNNFFTKIETFLKIYEDDIKENFSDFSIFNIFRNNKRILLFLFEEKIIIPNDLIYGMITSNKYKKRKYPEYFFPEFKSFYPQNYINELISKNPDLEEQNYSLYFEKRKIGENDSHICNLIRNDSVKEFIIYVNKTNLHLSDIIIKQSIYETNPLFLKNQASIIEYAAFFGSIQIFNFLKMNNVELTENLWIPAIHSQNADLIHLLEENHVEPLRFKNDGYGCSFQCLQTSIKNNKDYIAESIKCHHIDIMNYLISNLNSESGNPNFY